MRTFEYHEPETLEEASSLLSKLGPDAMVHAGGTDIIPKIRYKKIFPDHLINIKKMIGHVLDSCLYRNDRRQPVVKRQVKYDYLFFGYFEVVNKPAMKNLYCLGCSDMASFSHWSSQARTVSCHWTQFCGFSTQWFSSGK